MEVSKIDPCLFVGKKVISICYVDDILFWAKDEADINQLAVVLHAKGFLLEQEEDATGFLGVLLTKTKGGHIKMKQTGLIDRIIKIFWLDNCLSTSKWTPAEAMPSV